MRALFTILAFSLMGITASAQTDALGCIDKDIRMQAEGLKASFVKQGMVVYRDAMFTMESLSATPVGIQMIKGRMYQLIFVGNNTANEISLEIFDGNDKKIATKQVKKGGYNYIAYSFIPDKTDVYLVMLSQKFKGRSSCGSFTLMQEASANTENTSQNTVPAKK
jgi:hypothetical protein